MRAVVNSKVKFKIEVALKLQVSIRNYNLLIRVAILISSFVGLSCSNIDNFSFNLLVKEANLVKYNILLINT